MLYVPTVVTIKKIIIFLSETKHLTFENEIIEEQTAGLHSLFDSF